MTFEDAYATTPGDGWLTEEEARLLWAAAGPLGGAVLEVGSYKGRSTCLLARLGRPVFAVDPFGGFDPGDWGGEAACRTLHANLAERGLGNVTVFRSRVEDWPVRPAGFAYLDGDHTFGGTARQIVAAARCGVSALCLHDYADDGGGLDVRRAAEACGLRVVRRAGRMAHCRWGS